MVHTQRFLPPVFLPPVFLPPGFLRLGFLRPGFLRPGFLPRGILPRGILPLAICLGLLTGAAGQAQTAGGPDTGGPDTGGPDTGGPDTGGPVDRVYTPDWDGICAAGAALGEGCAAIRAREIVDAAKPSWRGVGRVNYASTRVRGHCTGTLVGERAVVTAAHCLYDRARKSWLPARSILFAAGYQRGGSEAVSRVARYVLDPAQDPTSRVLKASPSRDWALLILEQPIGRTAGVVALGQLTAQELWTAELAFAGYPSLREHVLSVERDCGGAEFADGGRLLLQQCAVMGGDSGGPVFAVDGADIALVAILSGVVRDADMLVSASVPVAVFAGAMRRELGQDALAPEIEALGPPDAGAPAAPAASPSAPAGPAPAKPTPPPAPIPTYPPPPPVGR